MKKFIRHIRNLLVAMYANRIYRKHVKIADDLHAQHKERFYVVMKPNSPNELIVINRNNFRSIKKCFRRAYSCVITDGMRELKAGAFYYTPDRAEHGKLSEAEKETRRLYFLRMLVKRAAGH